MDDLARKNAILAGGATLIGEGIARALGRQGVSIVIADIDEARGKALVDGLPGDARFAATDITDDGQINECVEMAVDAFGGVDILVNLACTYLDRGPDSDRREWLESLNVNVAGPALTARAVRPHLAARGGGSIVNVTSISAEVAQSGRWLYPASKAALVQLTRSMALDFAEDGIRVNAVSLGWTWSGVMDLATGGNRPLVEGVAAPFHILGRVGDPNEVGEVVAFLCSPRASLVTGADWAVDGGYSALGPERGDNVLAGLQP